jgi:hypothetical protein
MAAGSSSLQSRARPGNGQIFTPAGLNRHFFIASALQSTEIAQFTQEKGFGIRQRSKFAVAGPRELPYTPGFER